MRLLLTLGYQKILFGKGAPVSELILAVDGARHVRQSGGYGQPKRYEIDEDSAVEVELIPEESITLPESDSSVYDKFHAVAGERDEALKKVRELEKKLKEMTEKIGAAAESAKVDIPF